VEGLLKVDNMLGWGRWLYYKWRIVYYKQFDSRKYV